MTEPAFAVIGAELRAGERFLSILPSGAGALSQIRLLRPGEAEAGWLLEAIQETLAIPVAAAVGGNYEAQRRRVHRHQRKACPF